MNKKKTQFLKVLLFTAILLLASHNIVKADDTSTTPPTCTPPQTLDVVNNVCVDPVPTCVAPQTLINNVCTDPTPDPAPDPTPSPAPSSPALNIQASVDVPASCSATDTDGVVHNYPADGSSNSYLAICALEAAIKNGSISSVQLSNQYPTMGLFITSINGITADPSSQYWAIYQNGAYASSGIALLPVSAGDVLMFQLHDFSDKNLGDQVAINIHSLINNTPVSISGSGESTGGGYVHPIIKPVFDIDNALSFLASQQKSDGSFGSDLYTDWTGISLASNSNYQDQKTKLDTYFSENKLSGNLLTDEERHAMALMSLGLNPYNTNEENYIKDIISSFDGKQFGDVNQDNDDIFALIVLQNAGYTQNDQMINNDISFVLSKQNSDGSWDDSSDMTGAAMEALASIEKNTDPLLTSPLAGGGEIPNALTKAENYLKQNQKDDGSWNDNASSTAWAVEGILAQGEKIEDWIKNGNTPLDYLATIQDTDGGIKNLDLQNKIWETAYTVSALSGKTWNQIMQKFDKPVDSIPVTTTETTGQNKIAKKIVATKDTNSSITKNLKPVNSVIQNTASAINAITLSPTATQTETPKKNWFERLINRIFGSL